MPAQRRSNSAGAPASQRQRTGSGYRTRRRVSSAGGYRKNPSVSSMQPYRAPRAVNKYGSRAKRGERRIRVHRSVFARLSSRAFSPFLNLPTLPIEGTVGRFVPLKSKVEWTHTLSSGSGYNYILCCFTPSCVLGFDYIATTGYQRESAFLKEAKPSHVRPARIGCRLVCCTARDEIAGQVDVAFLDQPLNIDMGSWTSGTVTPDTAASWNDMFSAASNCKTYSAHQFVEGRNFHALPTSASAAKEWQLYQDTSLANVTDAQVLALGLATPAYGAILIRLTRTSKTQTYSVTFQHETHCKFPANTIHAQNEQAAPSEQETAGYHDAANRDVARHQRLTQPTIG